MSNVVLPLFRGLKCVHIYPVKANRPRTNTESIILTFGEQGDQRPIENARLGNRKKRVHRISANAADHKATS